jgi:hydrogenase-4 component H
MYLPKLREVKEALTSFFSAPYTTKFPSETFIADSAYRGKPRYNKELCIGCGTCAQVCPASAIEIIDNKENFKRTLRIDYCSCINCGQCEEKCITNGGVKLTNEHSFATFSLTAPEMFESIERDLSICECCGRIIACKDHLHWIKIKLGAKAYAHPNFLLEIQKQFSEPAQSKVKSKIRREDYLKEVCPVCKHKITVTDEF